MKRSIFETIIGAIVIIIAACFFRFAYKAADVKVGNKDIYQITALFSRIDGIGVGSEVRIGGIKIGTVTNIELDTTTFMAKAKLNIDNKIKLPSDSAIQVLSDGLLGGKFLNIEPGASDKLLEGGEEVKYTQSSVSIENLIGKYIFNGNKKD